MLIVDPLYVDCWSGLDWCQSPPPHLQNVKLLIVDINYLPPPTMDQQNANMGWIDNIVDCRSGTDQCCITYPPHYNKMWIWGGLISITLPPQINKIQIWAGLTKLLIADPSSIYTPPPPYDRHKNCSRKMITLSGTVPILISFNILISIKSKN